MSTYKILLLIMLLSASLLTAQVQYALLPVRSMGIDRVTTQTVDLLLRQEIVKETGGELISSARTAELSGEELCMDIECAVAIGSELNADKVVLCISLTLKSLLFIFRVFNSYMIDID